MFALYVLFSESEKARIYLILPQSPYCSGIQEKFLARIYSSVISASCANYYNLGLDREMAGHHCHPVSQQYQ